MPRLLCRGREGCRVDAANTGASTGNLVTAVSLTSTACVPYTGTVSGVWRSRARAHARRDRVLPCDRVHGDVPPQPSHAPACVLGGTPPPSLARLARGAMRQWSGPSPAPPPDCTKLPLKGEGDYVGK